MKIMKGYHDLYLKCDVLLLDDVFQNLGNSRLKNYRLCLGHYLSTSVWDAMLNMIKILSIASQTDVLK